MTVLVIILPLLVAGIFRIFTDRFKITKLPLDFGLNLFGKNKTWQGTIVMALISFLVGILIVRIFGVKLPFYYGLLLGLFYTFGELVNSFFKRRVGVLPGQNFQKPGLFFQYIFDQIDSTLAISVLLLFWNFTFIQVLYCFLFGSLIHFAVDFINHIFGSKKYLNKQAITYFYQVVLYVLLSPLKLTIKSNNVKISQKSNVILTSNHPFFLDSLFLLRAIPFKSFLNFAPFNFLVAEKFMKKWYGYLIKPIGAISTRESKEFKPRPLENLIRASEEGVNILICFEGKITNKKLADFDLKKGVWVLYKNSQKSLILPAKTSKGLPVKIDFKKEIGFHSNLASDHLNFLNLLNCTVYD